MFTFSAPFDASVNATEIFTVVSIRSLTELEASGEDPFKNIYEPVGLLESDFLDDLAGKIAIITFRTASGDYFYVPEDRVESDAKLDGIRYVEKAMIINLGYHPVALNTDVLNSLVNDIIVDELGTTPVIKVTDTSGEVFVTQVKHDALVLARNSINKVEKSWRTRYLELETLYNAQAVFIANMNQVYQDLGVGG